MDQNSIAVSIVPPKPSITLSPEFRQRIDNALAASALIGKVTNAKQNETAVRAQQELKSCISLLKKGHKFFKEPWLEGGRYVDRTFNTELVSPEAEEKRVGEANGEFAAAELQRVREEERLQQEELQRIEREKQAEIARVARDQSDREAKVKAEQEEAARKVREENEAAEAKAKAEKEAAEKLASEAKTKKDREAAAAAKVLADKNAAEAKALADKKAAEAAAEKEKQDAELAKQSEAAAKTIAAVEEKAGDQAYVAARPVEVTRTVGQRVTTDWEITRIDIWKLSRARPDLVTDIIFDKRAIKAELAKGMKLAGVEAKEVVNSGVVAPRGQKAIEV